MSVKGTYFTGRVLEGVRNAMVARGYAVAKGPADIALRWDWLADRTACAMCATILHRGAESLRSAIRHGETASRSPTETSISAPPATPRTRTCNV